jgi:hypothetical protein
MWFVIVSSDSFSDSESTIFFVYLFFMYCKSKSSLSNTSAALDEKISWENFVRKFREKISWENFVRKFREKISETIISAQLVQ